MSRSRHSCRLCFVTFAAAPLQRDTPDATLEREELMAKRWRFEGNERLTRAGAVTVRGVLKMVMDNLDGNDARAVVSLGQGDPSAFPSFRTTPFAEEAVCDAVRSAEFKGYASTVGIPAARRYIERLSDSSVVLDFCVDIKYLSRDLPYTLSPDDVFMTIGCTQALVAVVTVLTRPGANILLPRPGFPYYEARACFSGLEVRHFDLIPDQDWQVDLASAEALADENTVAMVVINPGNPCGNVFKYQHLRKVAETARNLGILVIADEVYGHLTFGNNPFVPMGVFASIVPIITIGSISKRWIVPGWRLGWLVTNDLDGILIKQGIVDSIKGFLNITSDPATFMQGAVPRILENTPSEFFQRIITTLRECADICYERSKDIPCITCPSRPEGSMFAMIKLNMSLLEDINDDSDFCCKLAKEESVVILPGSAVGLNNWLRVTFATEPLSLDDGFLRIKAFCRRHAKKQ